MRIESLRSRTAVSFSYDAARPEFALLEFADGSILRIESDSDYDPWTLVTPDGWFTAAQSDFDPSEKYEVDPT